MEQNEENFLRQQEEIEALSSIYEDCFVLGWCLKSLFAFFILYPLSIILLYKNIFTVNILKILKLASPS